MLMATQPQCFNTDYISGGGSLLSSALMTDTKLKPLLAKIQKILQVKTVVAIFPARVQAYVFRHDLTYGIEKLNSVASIFSHLTGVHTADHLVVDATHTSYFAYKKDIEQSFGQVHRLVALTLSDVKLGCLAQVCVFDQAQESFDPMLIELVQELCADYVEYIKLKQKHAVEVDLHEQAVALNFSQTKFLQIIAHDLRAPFHGILGFSDVLAEETDSLDISNIQSIASYLNDTAKATYHLLENLLNWAMAEGGRFACHPIDFDLKQSSQMVTQVLSGLAYNKNIELIDLIPNETYVYADFNMVTSVLQNLVSNALKFTHQDGVGKVTISIKNQVDCVELLVSDTGIGMSELQQKNIFHANINTTLKGTNGEKGTGLGLILCKRFVDLNQGEITVCSKEGEGTTFTVRLPMQQQLQSLKQQDNMLVERYKVI